MTKKIIFIIISVIGICFYYSSTPLKLYCGDFCKQHGGVALVNNIICVCKDSVTLSK